MGRGEEDKEREREIVKEGEKGERGDREAGGGREERGVNGQKERKRCLHPFIT